MTLTAVEISAVGTSLLLALSSSVPALSAPMIRLDEFMRGWQTEANSLLHDRLNAANVPPLEINQVIATVDESAVSPDAIKTFMTDIFALMTIPPQLALLTIPLVSKWSGPLQVLAVVAAILGGIGIQSKYWLHGTVWRVRKVTVWGVVAALATLVVSALT